MNLKGKPLSKAGLAAQLPAILGLSAQHSFSLIHENSDKLGFTHLSFQQYYQGVIVENGVVLVHFKKDAPDYINGKIAQLGNLSVTPSLSRESALRLARQDADVVQGLQQYPVQLVIATVNTGKLKEYVLAYKVRIDGRTRDRKLLMKNYFIDAQSGKLLKKVSLLAHTDVTATGNTYYSGNQTMTTDSVSSGVYRLRDNGRKIETYDGSGVGQDFNGNFVGERDYFNNSTSWNLFNAFSATTLQAASTSMLSNLGGANGRIMLFTLSTDTSMDQPRFVNVGGASSLPATNGGYYTILAPGSSYKGMYMKYNFNSNEIEDTAVYPLTNITPGTYSWNDGNGNGGTYKVEQKKNPALDAHWGMGKTHDYYMATFSRNSYDGLGSVVKNYVNFGDAFNASAAPEPYNVMMYGLGDGDYMDPVVGLDVMGHEFTHMVTEHNGHGGLDYEGESGALNESFSDIFGTSIEFYTKGSDANWTIGEGIMLQGSTSYMRSMSSPKIKRNPDTYGGQYWVNPNDPNDPDNGGVHTNSGVQNKWYYLLVQGGSGTNDKGNAYTVTGIGMAKAQQIVYRSLTTYMTPSAEYMDAYRYSLKATADLHDTTGAEYKAVKDAWYAVGIGEKDPVLSVQEIAVAEHDLTLYPNPAQGRVTIASKVNESLEAEVINVVGMPVMRIKVSKGLNPVDISTLGKGIYMIRYNTDSKGYVQKLTVL